MKKLFSYLIILFLLFSNFQIWSIYADSVSRLETEKEISVEKLEKVEILLEKIVDKVDKNTNDTELKEKLKEKSEEIKITLEKAKKEIEAENSKSDIKKIAEETKKIVVLKVVSGMTKDNSLTESIDSSIATTKKEKVEALETIKESLEDGDNYSLIVKSKLSQKTVLSRFKIFEITAKIDYIYSDSREKYFEIFIPKDWIFAIEMLGDLESWNIPEKFLWIEIVKPEVFSINDIDLSWEDLWKTWGIEKFGTKKYVGVCLGKPFIWY